VHSDAGAARHQHAGAAQAASRQWHAAAPCAHRPHTTLRSIWRSVAYEEQRWAWKKERYDGGWRVPRRA